MLSPDQVPPKIEQVANHGMSTQKSLRLTN